MHRTLPALKLPKSPLEFVIGQARYEPILTIDKGLPDIQNRLRLEGFTNYLERTVEVEQQILGQPGSAQTTRFKQWELMHSDKRHSFIIDRESISLQSTDYSTFEDFSKIFRIGIDALGEYAAPREARRIGLRYIDAVSSSAARPLNWYVNTKLLGPDLSMFGSRVGQSTETVVRTATKRRLKVRYVEAVKGLGLPVDVLPLQLQLKTPLRRTEQFAVLDSDHSDSNITEFSVDGVIERITSLHDVLDQVFRRLVTPEAIAYWSEQ